MPYTFDHKDFLRQTRQSLLKVWLLQILTCLNYFKHLFIFVFFVFSKENCNPVANVKSHDLNGLDNNVRGKSFFKKNSTNKYQF